jgi:alkylhydroperoxidase family enzyme
LVRRLGGTEEQLAELATFESSAHFSEAEKIALRLAEQMTLRPTEHIDDATWEALRQHYDEGQIVEIVCAAGIFNYFNRINNFLDIEVTK